MPDRYAVKMLDWRGHEWDFTGDWAAGIISGGIDGLVGSFVDTAAQPLGFPGQVVLSQHAEPMAGSLTFHCREDGRRQAAQVQADLRAAFSGVAGRRNELVVSSPVGDAHAFVRLNGVVPPPVEDPSWGEVVLNMQVPVICDEGVWWVPAPAAEGDAVVSNFGDVPVWVRIRWSGGGGRVVLPSGASFTLPAVGEERVLYLSRKESLVVRKPDGGIDFDLWAAVRANMRGVSPERVPVDSERRFRLPAGAQIEYEVGVMDPWQ